MKISLSTLGAVVAALGLSAAAQAANVNLSHAVVQSYIIVQDSTATVASGGNPLYQGAMPTYSGVTQLLMTYQNGNQFVCTGSLLNDRRTVLTAAHCVHHHAADGDLVGVQAIFYDGANRDANLLTGPAGSTTYTASSWAEHSAYTGEVIDEHDVATIRLSAPVDARYRSYGLFTGTDLGEVDYNVAGYGRRSDGGGNVGANLGVGRLRQGNNRYDFRMGDADFAGFFQQASWYGAQSANVWIADFDNGNSDNDASCRLAVEGFGIAASGKYCNLGRGATEVSTAPGDSGGPQFVNGLVASVTSFGLTFGSDFGDIDNRLNDTFGEFNGFASVGYNYDFIIDHMVSEPGSLALFGLAGLSLLRRRRKA